MNTTDRKPWKNLVCILLHWFLVVLLSMISFLVQYSFLTDTGEIHSSIIFSGSIYHVNYVAFPIGVAAFLIGYYVLWKRYLLPDWNKLAGRFWGWRAMYVLIVLIAMVTIFVVGIIALILKLGLGGNITPEWTTWGFVAYPVYILLIVVVEIIKNRKENL